MTPPPGYGRLTDEAAERHNTPLPPWAAGTIPR